jgi:hypothetical protein
MMVRTITVGGKTRDYTAKEEAEADAALIRHTAQLAEAELTAYVRKRGAAYPPLGDQLDMQYHDLVDGTTIWKDHVAKVKSDIPKP